MTDDAVFISGFTFIPSYVVHMWSKMNSDTCSDFACGRNIDVGIQIGNRVAQDVNFTIVLQAMAIVVGNEDKLAWILMNKATKAGNPHYDEVGTSDICDADKGAAAAFGEVFDNAIQKLDYLHRFNAIVKISSAKGGGADGAGWYKKAFRARSLPALEAVKSAMPTKTKLLLEKVPDQSQYPVAAPGDTTGATSSSPSESWNNTARVARCLPMAACAKMLVRDESARFLRNKEAARVCEATFPPRIQAALAEAADSAARINPSALVFQDSTKRIALVPLTSDSMKMARVDYVPRPAKHGRTSGHHGRAAKYGRTSGTLAVGLCRRRLHGTLSVSY